LGVLVDVYKQGWLIFRKRLRQSSSIQNIIDKRNQFQVAEK